MENLLPSTTNYGESQMSCARQCSSSMHQDKGYKLAIIGHKKMKA